ncbi:MAG: hypothetical protein F6K62_11460, partial [Sphaerospermopsis sp. SIO1G2]|nr:hypothetical protein [Sphaerospermopsis sp. SIO1G2]
ALMVITAFIRAINSLTECFSFSTIAWSVGVTAFCLILWVIGMTWFIHDTTLFTTGWLEHLFDVISNTLAVIVAWMLFPLLVPTIASLFIDRFLLRIAHEEYQHTLRDVPLREELPKMLVFILQALLINLVLLPFYFIPLIGQLLYIVVNGYLLARECWDMMCSRLSLIPASLTDRRTVLISSGITLMGCTIIPPLTLFLPLLAGATMLHIAMAAMRKGHVKQRILDA